MDGRPSCRGWPTRCASSARRATAVGFFGTATRTLLAGGQRAGVQHHVVLSIVGVDRVPWGYYQGKRHQEQLAIDGPVPATVFRATQFHEFADQMLQRGVRSSSSRRCSVSRLRRGRWPAPSWR